MTPIHWAHRFLTELQQEWTGVGIPSLIQVEEMVHHLCRGLTPEDGCIESGRLLVVYDPDTQETELYLNLGRL